MNLQVENDTIDGRGRRAVILNVDGYKFTVVIGSGYHEGAPAARGLGVGRNGTPMAHIMLHTMKPAPRSAYVPEGVVALWLDTDGVNPSPVPFHAADRKDWRLANTAGPYGMTNRMMSEKQWTDFRPVIEAVFRWAAEEAVNLPPQPDQTLVNMVVNTKRQAEQYREYYEAKESHWLSALDAYAMDLDRVRAWYTVRGLPVPELSLDPTT